MAITTFVDLVTTAEYMRAGNDDVMSGYTDDVIVDINKDVSKLDLYGDLIRYNGIDIEDEDNLIDEIVEYHTDYLQKLLSYIQLAYYYQENNDGETSQSFHRWQMYLKKYRDERNQMSRLLINKKNIVTTNRISLG